MANATVTIEGQSNVSAVAASDLEKARTAVNKFGSDSNKALGNTATGGDSALKSINGLYNGMQALAGSAIITGAIRIGDELLTLGGKSQVARQSLDAMTGGQLPQWLDQVSAAAGGTISRMDIMTSSNRALRLGVVDSAEEMAQLTNAARVLGKTMGEDTSKAMDDLTTGIGRGSRMILDNLGIIMKQEEIQSEVNKVLAENPGLTAAAAQKQALFNIAIAQANELQAQGVGTTNTLADSRERLKANFANMVEDVSLWLANGLNPWLDGYKQIGEANKAFSNQMLISTHSMADYNAAMIEMFHRSGQFIDQSLIFQDIDPWKAAREGAIAAITPINNMSTAAAEGGRAERDALAAATQAAKENAASLEYMDAVTKNAAASLEIYNQVLQRQSALTLSAQESVKGLTGLWWGAGEATKGTTSEINDLSDALSKAQGKMDDLNVWGGSEKSFAKTGEEIDILTEKLDNAKEKVAFGAGADWAGIFEFATGQMQNMGLAADQMLDKYNEIGLATGQVTQLQIEQGQQLAQLNNLYFASQIGFDAYVQGLQAINEMSVGTTVALDSVKEAAANAMQYAGQGSAYAIEQAHSAVAKAQEIASGGVDDARAKAEEALQGVQEAFDNLSPELKMQLDTTAADTSLDNLMRTIEGSMSTLPVDSDTTEAIAIAQAAVAKINSMVATITVVSVDQTGTGETKAFGGPAQVGGGLTLVGEHGPELVYLPPNSFVSTAPETAGLLTGMGGAPSGYAQPGGGPVTVNLYAYGVNDPIQLVDMVEGEIRARGKKFAEVD